MKTYKLKKDLPRAKAGSEVVLFPVKDNFEISRINLLREKGNNSRLGFINNIDIDEWLEEIPEKPKSVFDLKFGDKYFTKDSYGATIERNWQNNYTENQLQKEGKIFLTKEECNKDYEKELAIQRIKKYCWENNIELADKYFVYEKNYYKFSINFRLDANKFVSVYFENCIDTSFLFFKNEKDTINVMRNCEEDLKIIFNI